MAFNPDLYPEDFAHLAVGEDLATTLEAITSDAKLAALNQLANGRVAGQNSISNQNRDIEIEEGLLPFIDVGIFSPETPEPAEPLVAQPTIVLVQQEVNFGEVILGDPVPLRSVTIAALQDDLSVEAIFWTVQDRLSLSEDMGEKNITQTDVDTASQSQTPIAIPQNDYRTFAVNLTPQQVEVLDEELYILSNAQNTEARTINSEDYQVSVVRIRANVTDPNTATPDPPPSNPTIPDPPDDDPDPTPPPEPDRGTKGMIVGGESGYSIITDRQAEELDFYSETSTSRPDLSEERQWTTCFGSIHKLFVIGGSSQNRTLQTATGDVYEYGAQILYRTADELTAPTDMMTGSEYSFHGYTFGGDSFTGGSSNLIRETDLNANNILNLATTLSNPRSLSKCSEGDFSGSYIFGGATRPANVSATQGFNHTIVSDISHFTYISRLLTPKAQILDSDASFRLGSHSNNQFVYLAGGGGGGSTTAGHYGGIFSQKLTRMNKTTESLVVLGENLNFGLDSTTGIGSNRNAYFAGGYNNSVLGGTKRIQKLNDLNTDSGSTSQNEYITELAEQLIDFHSAGAAGQTVDYSSGWYSSS